MESSALISTLHRELLFEILKFAADTNTTFARITLVCKNWQTLIDSALYWKEKIMDLRERNLTLVSPPLSESDNLKAVFIKDLQQLKYLEDPHISLKLHPELEKDKYFIFSALKGDKFPTAFTLTLPYKSLSKNKEFEEVFKEWSNRKSVTVIELYKQSSSIRVQYQSVQQRELKLFTKLLRHAARVNRNRAERKNLKKSLIDASECEKKELYNGLKLAISKLKQEYVELTAKEFIFKEKLESIKVDLQNLSIKKEAVKEKLHWEMQK